MSRCPNALQRHLAESISSPHRDKKIWEKEFRRVLIETRHSENIPRLGAVVWQVHEHDTWQHMRPSRGFLLALFTMSRRAGCVSRADDKVGSSAVAILLVSSSQPLPAPFESPRGSTKAKPQGPKTMHTTNISTDQHNKYLKTIAFLTQNKPEPQPWLPVQELKSGKLSSIKDCSPLSQHTCKAIASL